MTSITERPTPALHTEKSCTGNDLIEYHNEDYGTIRFIPDNGIEGGHDGTVEIHSVDCLGDLERVHSIPPSEWRRIVAHVNAGLPRRNPIARLNRWIQENRA